MDELRLRNDRRLSVVMLTLFLVPTVWYLRTDFSLYAGEWSRLTARLMVRASMTAIALGAVIALTMVRTRRTYTAVVFAAAMGLAFALLVMNALRPEYSDLPLRSPMFTIAVMYGLLPNTTFRQLLPPLMLSAGLAFLRLTWLTSTAASDVAGDLIILLVMNTAGVLMVLRRRELENNLDRAWTGEHQARLASDQALADLRTLHGIIPICSFCKQVRTEIGDWQQIERYVQLNTHAQFSHGVCPSCRDQHYGDLDPATVG